MSTGKKKEKRHSTVKEHQHVGKTLVPPLLQIKGLQLASAQCRAAQQPAAPDGSPSRAARGRAPRG